MNQNDFLLLNAGVVTLVVIYLLVMRRKPADPVKLRLHDGAPRSPRPETGVSVASPSASSSGVAMPPKPPARKTEKALNVFFAHDGRTLDAFEVLQIPAGSSTASAQIAYDTLVRLAKPEQLAVLKAAITAIQKS